MTTNHDYVKVTTFCKKGRPQRPSLHERIEEVFDEVCAIRCMRETPGARTYCRHLNDGATKCRVRESYHALKDVIDNALNILRGRTESHE